MALMLAPTILDQSDFVTLLVAGRCRYDLARGGLDVSWQGEVSTRVGKK